MTTYNKATLKTFFQTSDIPTGTDYANFIDSYVNLVETAEQTMAGNLFTPELIASRVSADSISTAVFTVSAIQSVIIDSKNNISLDASGLVEVSAASNLNLNSDATITASAGSSIFLIANGNVVLQGQTIVSAIRALSDVSANTCTVHASALKGGVTIVSALGTTQAAAAPLTAMINRGKGVVDGSTTGFRCVSNNAGLIQYLFNEGASANLWPPTGGTINGLAANAAFALAASAGVTIVHLTASSMMAK